MLSAALAALAADDEPQIWGEAGRALEAGRRGLEAPVAMNASRFGKGLLAIGATVGMGAVIGLVVGFEPASLPRALINIAVYKLTFVAAAGLLAAGATLHRYARRSHGQPRHARDDAVASAAPYSLLGEGSVDEVRVERENAKTSIRRDTPR